MKRSNIAQSNASISILGERALVIGATQGIGEGVAYRFAKAGAEVWFVGRSESKATAVLAKLNQISEEQKINPPPEHRFLKADLSLTSEAKRLAEDIQARTGPKGVEYLIMCQGGPPNGTFVSTSEGHDQHYAVQVLSRFILAYKLALDPSTSTVKKSVISIMSPGKTLQKTDYDDLELLQAKEQGKYGLIAMASRDANVVDAFTVEFSERNPKLAFTHVFPGAVRTDFARNSAVPWYISALSVVALAVLGSSPESYAEVPFYMLANPDGRAATAKSRFWNQNLDTITPHPSSQEPGNRAKVWDHLLTMLGENK